MIQDYISLILMNENKHKFAEVFTPPELVKEILEKIETKNKCIYEPGVGKGAFLNQVNDFESYDGCEINPTKNFDSENIHIINLFHDPIQIFASLFLLKLLGF
jgi:type I restriction-modification system DNA methylase subunit